MIYYAKITKDEPTGYMVEFPDVEGCFSCGDTIPEAIANAHEALDGIMASRCDHDLDVPLSKVRRGRNFYPIEVDIKIAFAIMLRKARRARGLTQKEVAKKLAITQQAYAKLESPDHANPSLTTLKKLSEALEVDLELKLVS